MSLRRRLLLSSRNPAFFSFFFSLFYKSNMTLSQRLSVCECDQSYEVNVDFNIKCKNIIWLSTIGSQYTAQIQGAINTKILYLFFISFKVDSLGLFAQSDFFPMFCHCIWYDEFHAVFAQTNDKNNLSTDKILRLLNNLRMRKIYQ